MHHRGIKGIMLQKYFDVLEGFLKIPLESADGVFERFMDTPDHIFRGQGQQRFLYVRGSRRNKVCLVAHADTVWDLHKGHKPFHGREIGFDGDRFFSITEGCGLGADDRAGCAMLWILRDLGHSLLITDGEESQRQGSTWLMNHNKDIAEEINGEHQFLVQFDRRHAQDFKCYDVGTDEFRSYIGKVTGYTEPDRSSFTDIVTLCRRIAGVNLSIGYYDEHRENESLIYEEWENTLRVASRWLSEEDLPLFLREDTEG